VTLYTYIPTSHPYILGQLISIPNNNFTLTILIEESLVNEN